jgi:hypothetical protein
MKLSAEDQINCIKHRVYCSNEPLTQNKAMDALATYGKQAIDSITEIINSAGVDNQVKEHGLKVIEDIKK